MEEKSFKERVGRLKEVSAIIESLPAEIRSAAFGLLEGYVTGQPTSPKSQTPPPGGDKHKSSPSTDGTAEEFFSAFEHGKPADNLKMLVAYLYSRYGIEPFSLDEVRDLATEVGITIPDRIEMTFRGSAYKGKRLFVATGKGLLKPTIHGEAYLKDKYNVKKGTQKRLAEE